MELSVFDTKKAKGIAILGMVMLHLFCRLGELPYVPLIYIKNVPLIYYLGLFGDICVPIFCFCSGYAHILLNEKHKDQYNGYIIKKAFSFLLNYWIVVIIFCIVGKFTSNQTIIPGSIVDFLGNIFLFDISYNGAWWFVVTYMFLIALSPVTINICKKNNSILLILISGTLYFVAYIFRFVLTVSIDNTLLQWVWEQVKLLGTSQFAYVTGVIVYKEKWVSSLRLYLKDYKNYRHKKAVFYSIVYVFPVLAFLGHCIVQSLIVAPITAFTVLLSLFISELPDKINKLLIMLGEHSTNIWLVHMFFYMYIFEDLVFKAKYPILILIFMVTVCVFTSYSINAIKKLSGKRIDFLR